LATVTLLKDLKNSNKSLLEILNSFIFGNKKIEFHDKNKIYKKGDLILLDTDDGVLIKQAKYDSMDAEYIDEQWTSSIIMDWYINTGNNFAIISKNEPIDRPGNVLWYIPISYHDDINIPEVNDDDYTHLTTLFTPRAFATGEYEEGETPAQLDEGLFFDIESSEIIENYTSDDMYEEHPITPLTDNNQVSISDDPPTDNETKLWGDTDLTDNI